MTRALLLLVVACSNNRDPRQAEAEEHKARPKPEPKPLQVTWVESHGDQTFKVSGGDEKGEARSTETGVLVQLEGFDAGTQYTLGSKHGELGAHDSNAYVEVAGFGSLAAVKFDAIDAVDTGLTLELVLPDGRQGKTTLPPISFKYPLKKIFGRIENGPVVFGDEPKDGKPADSIFYIDGDTNGEIVGRAGKLAEIDFVVTQAKGESKGQKTCSGYTGPRSSITLLLKPTEVTLWDRRTGNVVEKKVFPPDSECPMFTMMSADETSTDSLPPTEKIRAWLKTKVKR